MRFAAPIWLLAGLAVMAALYGLFWRFDARQRAALAEFASSHLLERLTSSFSPGRRRLKRLLFSAGVALVFIALARPQLGYHWEEEKQRGIDIFFAVDTSKSMLTQDVVPDRLTRAKLAITDFVRKLGTDRVGLIAFAGDAFLQAPLTLDYDAFEESLEAIDTSVIPRGGTDIASAIDEAVLAFGDESKNKKILVLITDGEDLEAKGIEAAKTAAQKGLAIYTVGVGTSAGALIPVPGANGGTDFIKDASGQFVKSHLDESTLQQIAQATGGVYEPLGQHGEGLDKIYTEALASLPKQDVTTRRAKVYDERFQWPLALGLVLVLASTLIGTRRRDVKIDPVTQKAARRIVAAGLVAMATLVSSAHASPQAAEKAYKSGQFDDAEDEYEEAAQAHPDAAPLQFNMGDAAYKAGDYDKALPAFKKALGSDQLDLQQETYYNMGNTLYRVGEKTEATAPDEAVKQWQSAVQSYDAALKLRPEDADAKYNRDFVEKKLERLQKQQQQKKDQQKQDQQKGDKSESKQNQEQNQQNPGKSGSQPDPDKQQGQGKSQPDDKGNQGNGQQPSPSKGDQAGNQNGQNSQQPGAQPDQTQNGNAGQQDAGTQPKNQQGNPQDTAGNQGKPSPDKGQQPAGGGDQNSQVAQGQKSDAQGTGDKNGGNQQVAGGDAEPATPGALSREEARELLNSLKNDEHALPVTADARSSRHPENAPPLKDW